MQCETDAQTDRLVRECGVCLCVCSAVCGCLGMFEVGRKLENDMHDLKLFPAMTIHWLNNFKFIKFCGDGQMFGLARTSAPFPFIVSSKLFEVLSIVVRRMQGAKDSLRIIIQYYTITNWSCVVCSLWNGWSVRVYYTKFLPFCLFPFMAVTRSIVPTTALVKSQLLNRKIENTNQS